MVAAVVVQRARLPSLMLARRNPKWRGRTGRRRPLSNAETWLRRGGPQSSASRAGRRARAGL